MPMGKHAGHINGTMTVLDVLSAWRETETVFRAYEKETGICVLCNYLFCTLAETAVLLEIDRERLVADLTKAIP